MLSVEASGLSGLCTTGQAEPGQRGRAESGGSSLLVLVQPVTTHSKASVDAPREEQIFACFPPLSGQRTDTAHRLTKRAQRLGTGAVELGSLALGLHSSASGASGANHASGSAFSSRFADAPTLSRANGAMLVVAYIVQLYGTAAAELADTAPPPAGDVQLPLSSCLSWIPQPLHPLLRTLVVAALRLGPRPRHVAFIMDGNRRSARVRNLPVRVGHEEGFEALKRVLSFLLKLEIPHVTVYAFSIENFNRDPHEVDALLDMARTRLVEICQHGYVFFLRSRSGRLREGSHQVLSSLRPSALLQQHGVQIRVIGRRDLLPPDVQTSCAEAEALTAGNTRFVMYRLLPCAPPAP